MMGTLFGQAVFTVGGQVYFWEDVALAGLASGEWAVLERDLRHGLACVARARAEHVLPGNEELRAAAAAFRYERDLISAEEASGWLARWKVQPEDWMDYLRRALFRSRWCEDLATIADRFPPADKVVDAARHAEAVCSGTLARLARGLAERAACTARAEIASGGIGDEDGVSENAPRGGDTFVSDGELFAAAERLGISRAHACTRLGVLARVERSCRAVRRRVLSDRAVEGEIRAHQLEWTRLACDSVTFDSEAAAREALLCVRVDGQSLRNVAAAARRFVTTERLFLDQLPPAVGDRMAGARPGEAFGPVAIGGTFTVLQVSGKILPSHSDQEIVGRAEESLFSRVAQRELLPMVQWQSAL